MNFNTGYRCIYSLYLNVPYSMTDIIFLIDVFSKIRFLPEKKKTNRHEYNKMK